MELDEVFTDFGEDTGDDVLLQGPTIEVSPASTDGSSDKDRVKPSDIRKFLPHLLTNILPSSTIAEVPGIPPLSTMVATPFDSTEITAHAGITLSADFSSKDSQQAHGDRINELSHPTTPTSAQRPGTSPLPPGHCSKHTCECTEQDFDANKSDSKNTISFGVEGIGAPASPWLAPSLVFSANHAACMLGAPAILTSHVPVLDALPTTTEGGSFCLSLAGKSWLLSLKMQ
ncbi:hypothetical protein H0H87_007520 [Tephrocybe sp. NHM501043]|nr:hypothetical protein H0H87_007520 [Tephrocybe sp. NHM501043]